MSEQRCYNRHCNKLLTEEDKTDMGGCVKEKFFFDQHLCYSCFAKFDGQKMNGRWAFIGEMLAKTDEGKEQAKREQQGLKYTESVSEWIEWQNPQG
jgi:hypothetical protein